MFEAFGAEYSRHHGVCGPDPDPDHLPWKPDVWPEWGYLVFADCRDKRLCSGTVIWLASRRKFMTFPLEKSKELVSRDGMKRQFN